LRAFFHKQRKSPGILTEKQAACNPCKELPETEIDFKKYNVVLFRSGNGMGFDESYRLSKKNGHSVIDLNFYYSREPPGTKEKAGYAVNAVLFIYSRYILVPKDENTLPEVRIYETFCKCF